MSVVREDTTTDDTSKQPLFFNSTSSTDGDRKKSSTCSENSLLDRLDTSQIVEEPPGVAIPQGHGSKNGTASGSAKMAIADILDQGKYSPSHSLKLNFGHGDNGPRKPRSYSHDSLQGSAKAVSTAAERENCYGTPPKTLGASRLHSDSLQNDHSRSRSKAHRASFVDITHTISDELQEENAYFSMSHALMTVLEEYKSLVVDQRLGSDPREPLVAVEDRQQPLLAQDALVTDQAPSTLESPPLSPALYSENSCLFEFDPKLYQAGAHRCAHQLLTILSDNLSKSRPPPGPSLSENALLIPETLRSLLLKSKDISDALDEIRMRHAQRGTCDWAPPRQQVFFQIEPFKELRKQMQVQEYRCAGCRMEVEQSLSKFYRYCYYHGKYFCQSCHSDKKAILPAMIIHEWNFKLKSVSNIAHDLLTKIEDIPHYNISELNRDLYRRVAGLTGMKVLRQQLIATRQYIKTCRHASSLSTRYEELGHLATDCHVYSLRDLVSIEKGDLQLRARTLLETSFTHVRVCDICKYKGHYCEICQCDDDIIYPFEVRRVVQCTDCYACFHRECFNQGTVSCPKCVRLKAWRSKSDNPGSSL